MPTYKVPATFHPTPVDSLKRIFINAIYQDLRERGTDRRSTIFHIHTANVVAEVLYVRGMSHDIVDALLKEWQQEAYNLHHRQQEKEKAGASKV